MAGASVFRRAVRTIAVTVLALFPLLAVVAFAESTSGAPVPAFKFRGVDGVEYTNEALKGKIVVLEWFNPGCPFVERVYESGYMQKLQNEFTAKGVVWLTINSTSADHDDFVDAASVPAVQKRMGLKSTTVVLDPEGTVGHAFGAKTTPHMFVLAADGRLAYAGAVDSNSKLLGLDQDVSQYTRDALNELLAGKPVTTSATKPYGCSVKYGS